MAGFELKAGAHLTLLSSEEMHKEVDRLADLFDELLRGQEGETIVRSAAPFKTTSAGKGTGKAFRVPAGYNALLTRLVLTWPGASAKTGGTKCTVIVAATTATAASSARAINTSLPSVYEASKSHAPLFRGGQQIAVGVTTGPATQTIFPTVQVILLKRRTVQADIEAIET